MDLWEANAESNAWTVHSCSKPKTYVCEGSDCGDNHKNERYKGVCDKDGCDFNSYRMGEKSFFGPGSDFTVDSSKPMTVVTQFITKDGTDNSDLHEVRRYYVQNGRVIPNSHASILGDNFQGNSITDAFCDKQKDVFGDDPDFQKKGRLKTMSEALDRGMVLVLSLWDDTMSNMLWLDSAMGSGGVQKPGVLRGPCSTDTGKPQEMRQKYPTATVSYMNIKYGEINSTFNAGTHLETLSFDDLSNEVAPRGQVNEVAPRSHVIQTSIAFVAGFVALLAMVTAVAWWVKRNASRNSGKSQPLQQAFYQRVHSEAAASGGAVPEV